MCLRSTRLRSTRLALLAWIALLHASDVRACSDPEVQADLQRAARTLDPRARAALGEIDGLGRRLLAARSYLRMGDALVARWSWTTEEIRAYERSDEYARMLTELAKVTRRFEELNPGYTLYVNLEARSFELQLSRWNENRTVKRAAEQLHEATIEARCRVASDGTRAIDGADDLRRFLIGWRPSVLPSLAAPGLSLHGQLRAFDFQVKKGERIVAGPDTSTIAGVWAAHGWTEKLRDAVRSSSGVLQGPLESPNEPWHYVYAPER
jgi:hypothetical protein